MSRKSQSETGEGSPALQAFKAEVQGRLDAEGVATLEEWAEQRPGEHLAATYGSYPSCALCGAVKPYGGFQSRCKGMVRVTMRDGQEGTIDQATQRSSKTIELMRRACEAAKFGVDTAYIVGAAPHGFGALLTLLGSMRREGMITPEDIVTTDGAVQVQFKGGGALLVTDSQRRSTAWIKKRGRLIGRSPEVLREIDA